MGLIAVAEAGGGNRPARYGATPRFRADWIGHLRGPIAAAARLAPSAGGLIERLDVPAVAASFIEIQGGALLKSAVTLPRGVPVVEAFYHPSGGLAVLSQLIAGAADEAQFPSRRPVEVPIEPTARMVGVSSLQIRRVLKGATTQGLLSEHASPAYALTEAADAPLRFIYGGQFVQLLGPIAQTLARHPRSA
ncbi:hypothetical protein [Phenylobacterium sp.]|uniref:hypothetical protein n=1 Tax=Phenylobacterium sp. TaxID=1871053 RepID=UPI0012025A6C|nr:hypothetical protein [Phenylobacterium sp.]THD64176.1 MAG: hypothetical protein E8A12_08195 [Phenylobacterium sp.]